MQTELSGIKWRKLVWSESERTVGGGAGLSLPHSSNCAGGATNTTEPLEDPVLLSYARCLAADILCVWRRVPTPRGAADVFDLGPPPAASPPPLSLAASKELWIFWYGEEPDLSELVAPELNINGKCFCFVLSFTESFRNNFEFNCFVSDSLKTLAVFT